MPIKPAQLRKNLQQAVPGTVLLVGADAGLRRRCLAYLRDALGAERDEEYFDELTRLDGLEDALLTPPFFGGSRLCLLELGGERLNDELIGKLTRLAKLAEPPNHLVLLAAKLDRRGKLFKKLAGFAVDCEPLDEALLRRAAEIFLAERGVTADAEAVEHLVLASGGDVEALENRVETLSLNVGAGEAISGELAREALSATPGFNPFRLCDLITAGRPVEAVALTQRGLNGGEEPLRLLALLARHYRISLLVGEQLTRRSSDAEIARAVGVSAYHLSGYKAAARRLGRLGLLRSQRCLLSCDAALKLGLPQPATALLELVYALARGGEAGWPDFLDELPGAGGFHVEPHPALLPTG